MRNPWLLLSALATAAIAVSLAGCIDMPVISFLMPDGSAQAAFENEDIRIEFEYDYLDVFMKMTNLRTDQKIRHVWKPDALKLPDGSRLSMVQLLTTSKMQYLGVPPTRSQDGSSNSDLVDEPNMAVLSKLYNISKYGRTIDQMKNTRYMVGLVKDFMDESYRDTDSDIYISPLKVLSEHEPGDKFTLSLAYSRGPDFLEEKTVDISCIITKK